jgi:hypothetical protein
MLITDLDLHQGIWQIVKNQQKVFHMISCKKKQRHLRFLNGHNILKTRIVLKIIFKLLENYAEVMKTFKVQIKLIL